MRSMRASCTAPSARCTSRSSTAWRSKNRPITYHDIRGDRIVTRSGQEVRQDILAAMAALKSLGIGPGDRVAIAGTNSTRYLTLDVAIGMLGAVSVPLYYTSPPADIDHILAASGARLLFVGFNRLLERLGELPLGPARHLLLQRPRACGTGCRRAARHGLGGVPGTGPPAATRSQAADRLPASATWRRCATPRAPPAGPRA